MAEIVDTNVMDGGVHNDWQALKSSWKGRMSHLYYSDVMSDITFKVKGERFKAHKFVMASASSVFYAMFYGPVAERRSEIEIVDCGASDYFREFLKFVYTEELSLTWENLFAIAYLAKKYYIPSLINECCKFLLESLTMENVLGVLSLCLAADQQEMSTECLRLIRVRIRELTRTQEFLDLDQDALSSILSQDILDMKEHHLFRAVDRWCKYQLEKKGIEVSQEAKREILGEAVNMIRFPTLQMKVLGNDCYPSGLITKDQLVDLICMHTSGDFDMFDKRRMPFEISKRQNSNFWVDPETTATTLTKSYGSCFRVNRKVWLKGVAVIGDCTRTQKVEVITIKGGDGTCRMSDFVIKEVTNSKPVLSHLIFKKSIEILPGVEYNVVDRYIASRETGCWDNALGYSFGDTECEFIKPTLCRCWGINWHNFPRFFFSQYDGVEIPTEEVLLGRTRHCK
eukprot:Seg1474.1 transcript_id=Seg1474.1/GoldUCD/mRNA.D3Y31 product="BTB/POZ domain-containing protein 6" protein_id=Seg1474.1/GoldUCD/D3Y31